MACLFSLAPIEAAILAAQTAINSHTDLLWTGTIKVDIDNKFATMSENLRAMTSVAALNNLAALKGKVYEDQLKLKQAMYKALFVTECNDNWSEVFTEPQGKLSINFVDYRYYPTLGGGVKGYYYYVYRKVTYNITECNAVDPEEYPTPLISFQGAVVDDGAGPITNSMYWGIYISKDNVTWQSATKIEREFEAWVMYPAKSMLGYINALVNVMELGTSKQDEIKMNIGGVMQGAAGFDIRNMWGFRSEGSSDIDNWTSEWWRILFPQWHSNMGGPK